MDANFFLPFRSGVCGPRQNFSASVRQLPLTRAVAFVTCLALQGVLPGCMVSQATHDEALQEIQSLQAANRTLKTALDAAQSQGNSLSQGSPVQTDTRQLQTMLSRSATIMRGQGSAWDIQYGGMPMMVMTSEEHDRMRIMAMV